MVIAWWQSWEHHANRPCHCSFSNLGSAVLRLLLNAGRWHHGKRNSASHGNRNVASHEQFPSDNGLQNENVPLLLCCWLVSTCVDLDGWNWNVSCEEHINISLHKSIWQCEINSNVRSLWNRGPQVGDCKFRTRNKNDVKFGANNVANIGAKFRGIGCENWREHLVKNGAKKRREHWCDNFLSHLCR